MGKFGPKMTQIFRTRLELKSSRRVLEVWEIWAPKGAQISPILAQFGPKSALRAPFGPLTRPKSETLLGPKNGPKSVEVREIWEFGFAKFGLNWEILGPNLGPKKFQGSASSGIARGGFWGRLGNLGAKKRPDFADFGPF